MAVEEMWKKTSNGFYGNNRFDANFVWLGIDY